MTRRIIATKEAATQLENQLDYLIDHHAHAAAHQLKQRFDSYLANHVAEFPRTGRYLAERDLWETWIPRTRQRGLNVLTIGLPCLTTPGNAPTFQIGRGKERALPSQVAVLQR